MIVRVDFRAITQTRGAAWLARFVLGGAITVATGLIAEHYGPLVRGLFLAFPAIFPASATLVEQHEREKKRRAGIMHTNRGRKAAALDARGAAIGALALIPFALLVWRLLPTHSPAGVLAGSLLAWLAIATLLWRLRRWHTRLRSR
jgi:Protein of unknown function (DUF3147)/Domain of unknown function (DUF202)